ncbi:MAG: 7-carboxy-7-deazaguanine synthase QueE [Elusimicrobiota bacterium]|jgi:organic radical activating enzyme|nr:7-carboxy-7-deazaguanine synthase QueE [Elusimicrobiota bacterium]
MNKVAVNEVFFSYQGEGLYAGMAQIFVRFFGCNIKCCYCDTSKAMPPSQNFKMLTSDELLEQVLALYQSRKKDFPPKKHSISFTGGEPLLHAAFLKNFFPLIKKHGFEIYIETNGTLPEKLKEVIKFCQTISMDFKLPSQCGKSFWSEHKEFLKIAAKKEVFVKCVITKDIKLSEIKKAAQIIKEVRKDLFFILQPSIAKDIPELKALYAARQTARAIIKNVVIMPQLHKIYSIP